MGQTQLVYKVGCEYSGFISENLGRAKGLKYFIYFSFSHKFVFYYEVSMGVKVDNSIRLKKLQVVSRALRKKDEGLGFFFFLVQKGIFG
jgi:hypothetical protein